MTAPRNPVRRLFLSSAKPPQLPEVPEKFTRAELRGARFLDSDLSGAWFGEVNLRYARLRGVDLINAEIWGAISGLVVNGVEIEPLIEAELDRRHPGRARLFASDPDGVRAAWTTIETYWSATVARARRLPESALHERVNGEWSFLETLRHLVLVDDGFLRQVSDPDRPVYRQGVPHTPLRALVGSKMDLEADPSSHEVFDARQDRMAQVRAVLGCLDVTELRRVCPQPAVDHTGMEMPVLHCVWRMINEEWEHHSFAVRDLEVLETRALGVTETGRRDLTTT